MSKRVDQLNIILLLISAVIAYFFPLELFVFSLAILGPIHYMTEINWLNSKNFYFTSNNKIWLMIGCISAFLIVAPKLFIEYGGPNIGMREIMIHINEWSNGFIFATLLLAIGYQFIKSNKGWVILSVLIVISAVFLNSKEYYISIVGLFVPTIIHVYLFTMLFMVFGARKAKSTPGFIGVFLLILLPVLFIFIPFDQFSYLFPDALKSIYLANNFHVTPVVLAKHLGISDGKTFFFYETMELRLMMFISFIYFYHYLNWFSKTTVIHWYKSMNFNRTLLILAVWGVLLILYYVDFRLGFLISLFLSILHVILEFPLNIITIRGLFRKYP